MAGTGGVSDNEYDGQNMQTLEGRSYQEAIAETEDYLRSTRTVPLSTYEIKAGWEIPAVLEQNLNSDLPRELKALVMSNVYDTATGRYLLIPQGSRLIGRYDSRISYGQDGVQVAWDRIMFPDASSIDINGMVGLHSHGNAGLRNKVDRHYKRLFGFAAMTSLFSAAFDLSQRQTFGSGVAYPSVGETASASVGRELSQTGAMITRRNLNVQPTITVPVGYKFTVRVNRDMIFDSPYHPLGSDPQRLFPGDLQLSTAGSKASNGGWTLNSTRRPVAFQVSLPVRGKTLVFRYGGSIIVKHHVETRIRFSKADCLPGSQRSFLESEPGSPSRRRNELLGLEYGRQVFYGSRRNSI